MSDYAKSTNFTTKDTLPSGNSQKIVKGTELDIEFTNIASAISSKANSDSPTFTGIPLAATASIGTNTTQLATTAFVLANSIPSGLISLWSGSVASVPSGWYLCNGSNGTPNLQDRFIVGAGSTYAVGATGGSANATLVSHTHSASSSSYVSDPGHYHLSSGTNGGSQTGFLSSDGDNTQQLPTTSATTGISVSTSTSISTEGASATNANLPPYYALAYIMKA